MNVNTNRLVFDNIQSVPTKKVEVQVNSLPKFKSKQNSSTKENKRDEKSANVSKKKDDDKCIIY